MSNLKELFLPCSETATEILQVVIDPRGEAAFLINNLGGECLGEVCLDLEQTIKLRDWLTKNLRGKIK